MTPAAYLSATLRPAAALLMEWTSVQTDARGEVLLLAIALQESGLRDRVQINGPAHSYFQLETIGVQGVLADPVAGSLLVKACARLLVPPEAAAIYAALIYNDNLAVICGRLLLLCDPAPFPEIGDVGAALAYYARNWRPAWYLADDVEPGRWDAAYAAARAAVEASLPLADAVVAGIMSGADALTAAELAAVSTPQEA